MHVVFQKNKRVIIKYDILSRQYYTDHGEVSHLQVLLPGQLLKVLRQSLHGTDGKHQGISQMMQKNRQKFYFPSIATYVRNCVPDCERCTQDKRIKNTRITPELFHIPEWDLRPEISCTSTYCRIYHLVEGRRINLQQLTFFREMHLLKQFLPNPTAANTLKAIIDVTTRHAFLPTLTITDKGSVFVSQVRREVGQVLGLNVKHATTKHAQTIGVLERVL